MVPLFRAEMMRMSHTEFLQVLKFIERDITPKQISGGNPVVKPKERLTLTLRFLATGETYRSLAFQFRISKAAISYIVVEVWNAVTKNMQSLYMRIPSTANEWLEIASNFEQRWQYPHCIGAIDRKHIVMQPPPNSGSKYYNYKHTHSIILMAIAGPDYECTYADVGKNGRASDGGVWSKCYLAKAINEGIISFPSPVCLPYGSNKIPYVFVGDEAFALKPYLMKPYPQSGLNDERRVYTYRHSRARRISENLFGIISSRWRVFRSAILLPPKSIETITLATLCIHNFLRKSGSRDIYCPAGLTDRACQNGDIVPGSLHKNPPIESLYALQVPSTGHNSSTDAKQIREALKNYFCNEGAVEWQWDMC